jgi:hypothetical protein
MDLIEHWTAQSKSSQGSHFFAAELQPLSDHLPPATRGLDTAYGARHTSHSTRPAEPSIEDFFSRVSLFHCASTQFKTQSWRRLELDDLSRATGHRCEQSVVKCSSTYDYGTSNQRAMMIRKRLTEPRLKWWLEIWLRERCASMSINSPFAAKLTYWDGTQVGGILAVGTDWDVALF